MFNYIKAKVITAPTPMGGLALGIASLGWAWENMFNVNGAAQYTGAAIASVLLLILGLKFLLHPQLLKADLAHPVAGSVVPTFAMATLVVSNSLGHVNSVAGDVLWVSAFLLHLGFLLSFIVHRVRGFKIGHMVPSWFVPPVGIIVADVAFSGNPALLFLAQGALYFGMLMYAVMLPLMIYRIIFAEQIPDAAQPTLAILAAPASLSLAGYFTVNSEPSPVIIGLLFGIAVLMTFIIYVAFFKLLRRPFCPGYAAFTFPVVIGATALFKLAAWMHTVGIDLQFIKQIQYLATFELIVASGVVCYVAVRYLAHFKFFNTQFKPLTLSQ
ncbi:TDT family transporter [Pseudoalteromonas tetraodonis]|uniref:TDT family transporter n=1 Tax=Pseudoalteromonas tetraodonis TaxID=43659 RepID=UPI000849B0C2|nr:TDT family transporter [Pseudoalteromonas tetraodonis]ODS12921.1 C4-dicarboxylate ABC transporter [Pseudoalteromonas tetraodonis]